MAQKNTESHVTIPALKLGIEHLGKYAEELGKFDTHIKSAASELGNSNRDQAYDKFMDYFDEFWPTILVFKTDVLEFNKFLEDKKKEIEAYNDIDIKDN